MPSQIKVRIIYPQSCEKNSNLSFGGYSSCTTPVLCVMFGLFVAQVTISSIRIVQLTDDFYGIIIIHFLTYIYIYIYGLYINLKKFSSILVSIISSLLLLQVEIFYYYLFKNKVFVHKNKGRERILKNYEGPLSKNCS